MDFRRSVCSMLFLAVALGGAVEGALAQQPVAPEISLLQEMGQVNGLALACKQPVISVRLREAVVNYSAKDRTSGEAFEQATSEAYLKQGKTPVACPDGKRLSAQVEDLVRRLQTSAKR